MFNISIPASPITKCLKFEAVPMWDTAEYAKKVVGPGSLDEIRKIKSADVKDIIREYARFVIKKADAKIDLSEIEKSISKYAELKAEIEKDKKDKKNTTGKDKTNELDKAIKSKKLQMEKYRKGLLLYFSDAYGDTAADYQLFDKGDLFSDKKSVLLNDVYITLPDSDKDLLRMYKGMTSYFDSFFRNLELIFKGTLKNSIADRVVENIDLFYANEEVFDNYEGNIKEFVPESLHDVSATFTQKRIDEYNAFVGDLCSYINEYRQKNPECGKIVYPRRLYKIPLGVKTKRFEVSKIENKEEFYAALDVYYDIADSVFEYAKKFEGYNFSLINPVLSFKRYGSLSAYMYGDAGIIAKAIREYNEIYGTEYTKKDSLEYNVLGKILKAYESNPNKSMSEVIISQLDEAMSKAGLKNIVKGTNVLDNLSAREKFIEYLDAVQSVGQTLRFFDTEDVRDIISEDLQSVRDLFYDANTAYNMFRSYCSKKPTDTYEYPVTFDKSTFLASLDADKFASGVSLSALLKKDDMFYLLVLDPDTNKLNPDDYTDDPDGYQIVEYKQLNGLNKMFPKVFLADSNEDLYKPSEEIIDIVKKKKYTREAEDRESCVKWIQFCIDSFNKNSKWSLYGVTFKKAEEYESANEFYTETEKQTTSIGFGSYISEIRLRKGVAAKEMYLFKIYSRDMSPNHRGNIDAQVRLLREAFSDENLKNISKGKPCVKLTSGGHTLTFRKASVALKATHPEGSILRAKNPNTDVRGKRAPYDICKDRRFTKDKFLISLCVKLGCNNADVTLKSLNEEVNKTILKEQPNILAIKVGEKDLLHYCVIDKNKNILEENSLTVIENVTPEGAKQLTDYSEIIDKRKQEAEIAKKRWNYSTDIKDVKKGYLSAVVHKVVTLAEKYNAIICIEDFTVPFMQKRMANFGQVYRQFQKTLVNKFSCYQKNLFSEAKQYCCRIDADQDLKGQNGIIFFVNPAFVSKTDPYSGFVNQIYECLEYENTKKAKETLDMISLIERTGNDYKIVLNQRDFKAENLNKEFTFTTAGMRTVFDKDKKKYVEFSCSEELRKLFAEYKTDELTFKDADLPKAFYERFLYILKVLVNMFYADIDSDTDYFISPVGAKTNASSGAAVKAYTLALKCKLILEEIDPKTLMIKYGKKDFVKNLQTLV